jgi:hypothetical protein
MSESCCPFCGARLVEGTAPSALGLVIGLAMFAACGPGKPQDETASEGTSSGDGSSGGAGTTTAGTSTTSTDTSGASTQQPTTSGDGSSGCGATGCESSSEGGGFIYGSPDDGGAGLECDQFVQDCPIEQKCAPASLDGDQAWESLVCVPVQPNPDQTGEPCTAEGLSGVDSCDVGNICFMGECVALCSGTPDEPICPEGTVCVLTADGVFTPCLEACDPLAQDCPNAEENCIADPIDPNRFICAPDGSGAGGQTFDACDSAIACDKGHVCAPMELAEECDEMRPDCCLPFCDLSQPPACTGAGADCLPWFEEGQAPPGLENVGICGAQ